MWTNKLVFNKLIGSPYSNYNEYFLRPTKLSFLVFLNKKLIYFLRSEKKRVTFFGFA